MKRNWLNFLGLWFGLIVLVIPSNAISAPTISSCDVNPGTLTPGASFTVTVQGTNIDLGIVLLDFRPTVATLLRLPLTVDSVNSVWTAAGNVPSITFPPNVNSFEVTVTALVFDPVRQRATQVKQIPLQRNGDTTPPTLNILSPADGTVVNQSQQRVRVAADDNIQLAAIALGTNAVPAQRGGTFDVNVNLIEGANQIALAAFDSSGNQTQALLNLILDTTPPNLAVDEPTSTVVNTTTVHIAGQVSDSLTAVTVTVGGQNAPVQNNAFGIDLLLPEGANSVEVIATDAAGNQTNTTLNINVFVSAPMSFATPEGAQVDFPAGALTRLDQTVVVRDLTTANIQNSLGTDSSEIVSAVPPGGLDEHTIVIPGAMAITFDGASLPDPMVNGMPSFSVPAMGGLTNDMPLWILQLIPDTDGDGLPQLMLVSEARISDDGTRLTPVPPPPGSPLPGFQFGSEFGFDASTINQVDGIVQSSRTFVACCCGQATVPIVGNTNCNPGPTAKRLMDGAKRIADGKKALQNRLRGAEAMRRDLLLNQMLGVDGSLTDLSWLILEVALAGRSAGKAAEELAAVSKADKSKILLDGALDILGPTPPTTNIGLTWKFATKALEDGSATIQRARDDIGKYIDLSSDIEVLNRRIENDDIHIQGLLAAAHDFGGCSSPILDAANAASAAAAGFRSLANTNQNLLGTAVSSDAQLAVTTQDVTSMQNTRNVIEPLANIIVTGTATDADLDNFETQFQQLNLILASLETSLGGVQSNMNAINAQDAPLALSEDINHANLTSEFARIDALPTSDGVVKEGINVSLAGFGQHHNIRSASGGRFGSYFHTSLKSGASGGLVLSGGDATVDASLGVLSGSKTVTFGDSVFAGGGQYDFAIDVGDVVLGLDAAGLADTDGDGVEDAGEDLGGTDKTNPDTDSDTFDDLVELFAGSDPADASSVPSDDRDGDSIPDSQEPTFGTDADNADTDGDFLLDGAEVNIHGTNPLNFDTDGDNFTDWAEILLGSDPNDANSTPGNDADSDGIPDVVESNLGTDINNPDTDGDGLSDGFEFYFYRTNPTLADSDGDTIIDPEEISAGADGFVTDPRDRDTDRDGFLDDVEIDNGSDPTDPTSIPILGGTAVDLTLHVTLFGAPAPGASVTVFDQFEQVLCQGTTDDQGNFICPQLSQGLLFFASISHPDSGRFLFTPQSQVVDQGGGRMQVDISLD